MTSITNKVALAALGVVVAAFLSHATPPVITNIALVPRLTVVGDTGTTNQIQARTNLNQGEWEVLTNIVVTQSPYWFVDVATSTAERFYRVVQFPTNNPNPVVTFVVSGFPASRTAGVSGTFTVTAQDAFANTVTGYSGTVVFSSSDPQATLPTNTTFTPYDAGVRTFSATFKTAGIRSITVNDTVTSNLTGSQGGIVISPAAAAFLSVSGFPFSQTAGTPGGFTVTARDAFGNLAVGYLGTVAFSSSDPFAVLPANTTFTSQDAGTRSFSATLNTAGVQSLSATDTATNSITGSQGSIFIVP